MGKPWEFEQERRFRWYSLHGSKHLDILAKRHDGQSKRDQISIRLLALSEPNLTSWSIRCDGCLLRNGSNSSCAAADLWQTTVPVSVFVFDVGHILQERLPHRTESTWQYVRIASSM